MSDTFFGGAVEVFIHRDQLENESIERAMQRMPIEVRQRNRDEIMAIHREFDAVLERLQAARKEAGWLPITVSVPEDKPLDVK